MSHPFNLISAPWIPVLRTNGRFERVGIRAAHERAGSIRQIAASSAMDNVALLRFLLAVLMWCRPGLSEEDRRRLDGAAGIPSDWLATLGTTDRPNPAFDLLGDGRRFFQERSAANSSRPIGDLFFELPVDTNVAHFRHLRDQSYGICPACCAVGLIRHSSWAPANRFYTAPVNGPSPTYALSCGPPLLRSLLSNLPETTALRREPPWLNATPPTEADLDAATAFAWRSRRVWLGPLGSVDEICACCGASSPVIRAMQFAGNWKQPFATAGSVKKFWRDDPHLVLENDTTLPFPDLAFRATTHVRLWRRVALAELKTAIASHDGPRIVVGATKQDFLYHDSTAIPLPRGVSMELVPALEEQATATGVLPGLLRRSAVNPDRQHPNRAAALDALSPDLEAALRRDVERSEAPPESDRMRRRLAPVVERTVRSTTAGSPFRRREALCRAHAALDRALRGAAADPVDAVTQQPPAKPKRTRKKGGDAA